MSNNNNNNNQTLDLNAVEYDVYTSTEGIKRQEVIEVKEGVTDKGYLSFRLKLQDQNGEVSFEDFDLSVYGQRKIKKFCEKTQVFTEKEMSQFNHYNFLGKKYEVEYFLMANKHHEPTNPNSRTHILVIGNKTYAPIKESKKA